MPQLIRLARWVSEKRRLPVVISVYLIVFTTIFYLLRQLKAVTGGYGILDFDQGYDANRVREVLNSYGEVGNSLYAKLMLLDLINPALFAVSFAGLTYHIWKDRGPAWFPILPFFGALGDYLENATLFLIWMSFSTVSEMLVSVSSFLGLIKFPFLFLSFAPMLLSLVLLRVKHIIKRLGPNPEK